MYAKQNIRMKTKVKWLSWLMDFCNLDIKSVSKLKRLELYFALRNFDTPNFEVWIEDYEKWLPKLKSVDLPPIIWDPIPLIQDKMRSFLNKVILSAENIYIEKYDFSYLPLPDLDRKPVLLFSQSDAIKLKYVESKVLEIFRDQKKMNRYLEYGYKATESIVPLLPLDYFIISLGEGLDGVPPKWIQKCKGCGSFFLNPTERGKIYCNSSCASRSITRMKREKLYQDPKKREAYRKKMREIMRKKYEASQKAKGYKKITHYNKKEE